MLCAIYLLLPEELVKMDGNLQLPFTVFCNLMSSGKEIEVICLVCVRNSHKWDQKTDEKFLWFVAEQQSNSDVPIS